MTATINALISSTTNIVDNTIVADSDFELDGYYLVEISQDNPASTGMVYNKENNTFSFS